MVLVEDMFLSLLPPIILLARLQGMSGEVTILARLIVIKDVTMQAHMKAIVDLIMESV